MKRRVHTAHGPGVIVESETVRGREQFRVAGEGFSIWLFASDLLQDEMPPVVNEDNSTELPYDPSPQVLQDGASTIAPGEETIDPDERLSPVDSLDVFTAAEGPGPNPDLFADTEVAENEFDTDVTLPGQSDFSPDADTAVFEAASVGADPAEGAYVVISSVFGDRAQVESLSMAQRLAMKPESFSPGYREARTAGQTNPFENYHSMLRTSSTLREAAWADVRRKAVRLRREGQVDVVDEDRASIVAYVLGDHDLYESFVIRQGFLGGSGSVSEWSCSCPWGYWAHRRQDRFAGRMCSHAYATYMELRSRNYRERRDDRGRFTAATDDDYPLMGEYKVEDLDLPDELTLEPHRLTPDLEEVERDYEVTRVDIEDPEDFHAFEVQAAADDDGLLDELRDLSDEGGRPQRQKEYRDDVSDVVEELRQRGYDADPLVARKRQAADELAEDADDGDVLEHETANGSGYAGPLDIEPSAEVDRYDSPRIEEDEVDHEESEMDFSDPTEAEMERHRMNRESSTSEDDVVAQFQRNASWLAPGAPSEAPAGGSGMDDFAGAAQAFLSRTAGRHFTFAEQQELIDEGRPGGASNLDELDLDGTHYVDLA